MKNIYTIVLVTVFVVVMVGCGSSDNIKLIKEETIAFDITEAKEMIETRERLLVDLGTKDTITKSEREELEVALGQAYDEQAREFILIFVGEYEYEHEKEEYDIQETFFPTVFHKGIDVTGAEINKTIYENEFFNETYLRITQEYTGDDEKLKDWQRDYVFRENQDGEWEVFSFSGVMNLNGESFTMEYLELEKE